jgi:hypothetical protein
LSRRDSDSGVEGQRLSLAVRPLERSLAERGSGPLEVSVPNPADRRRERAPHSHEQTVRNPPEPHRIVSTTGGRLEAGEHGPGQLSIEETVTIREGTGTGRFTGASRSFKVWRIATSPDGVQGTTSGTFSGTIVLRGDGD